MNEYKFNIENGEGLLKIRLAPCVDYLEYNSPVVVRWLDEGPSTTLCDYLSTLPWSWEQKDEVRKSLNNELDEQTADTNYEAYKTLEPLLGIFQNGDYSIAYDPNSEFDLIFPAPVEERGNAVDFFTDPEVFKRNNDYRPPPNTTLIDPWGWKIEKFIATQSEIDFERVEYYRNRIKNGKRPFAVIFSSYFWGHVRQRKGKSEKEDFESMMYVIDGHHKLMAYKKEKLKAPFINIKHLPTSITEVLPNLKELFHNFQPWHFKGILSEAHATDPMVISAMKADDELFKDYIKSFSLDYTWREEYNIEYVHDKLAERYDSTRSWMWKKTKT